ncbi:50S ribosomal protein L21 [Candidatus Termititenax persephonae]|uniref:Large ribosomal subunit protein bL21 n=1 Tax=Candidatus Termititenax persephonae TaxID=2218525 RepID=A0A388TK51_9BACT|nr:50S ribosomal protein L21 [Candidatus Termititenax persephonae]
MYAVIETGGKQYKVSEGEVFPVEKLAGEKSAAVVFDKVLLTADGQTAQIGQPYVSGASVQASVVEQVKGEKIIVQKFRPKTGYNRKNGHRQNYTVVKIEKINK